MREMWVATQNVFPSVSLKCAKPKMGECLLQFSSLQLLHHFSFLAEKKKKKNSTRAPADSACCFSSGGRQLEYTKTLLRYSTINLIQKHHALLPFANPVLPRFISICGSP